jgi:hypothetical protein
MKNILFGTPLLAVMVFFLSCGDFFTTSLATWAQRDTASLFPPVTKGNVAELTELAENDPDWSLALLKDIAKTADSPELQAAALRVAANASGLGAAILQHADDIANIDEDNAKGIVIDALNGLSNAVETGAVLESVLPPPGTAAWDDFVAASGAEDLAMAAVVLLAGKAKNSGDPENYIDTFPDPPAPGSTEALAKELADAARAGYGGGGFLEDILSGLHL